MGGAQAGSCVERVERALGENCWYPLNAFKLYVELGGGGGWGHMGSVEKGSSMNTVGTNLPPERSQDGCICPLNALELCVEGALGEKCWCSLNAFEVYAE